RWPNTASCPVPAAKAAESATVLPWNGKENPRRHTPRGQDRRSRLAKAVTLGATGFRLIAQTAWFSLMQTLAARFGKAIHLVLVDLDLAFFFQACTQVAQEQG